MSYESYGGGQGNTAYTGTTTYGVSSTEQFGGHTEYASTSDLNGSYQPYTEYPAAPGTDGATAYESAEQPTSSDALFSEREQPPPPPMDTPAFDFSSQAFSTRIEPPPHHGSESAYSSETTFSGEIASGLNFSPDLPLSGPYGGDTSAQGDLSTGPVQSPASGDSVSRLANKFSSSTLTSSSSPSTDGKSKKWVVDTSKGSSSYVPGSYTPVGMPTTGSISSSSLKRPVAFDPAHVDTSSANVSEVRNLWQQKAKNAPPPMPKVKAGGLAVATESVSTVHTVGLIDRSAFARMRTGSSSRLVPPPQTQASDKDQGHDPDAGWSAHKAPDAGKAPALGGGLGTPVGPPTSSGLVGGPTMGGSGPSVGGGTTGHGFSDAKAPAAPAVPTSGAGQGDAKQPQQVPAQKPLMTAPPTVEFNMDQFKELMDQIDTGDADQKAYAAMELQTMALDSRSQVLMAHNGSIGPLVKLLQPGDPMVQAKGSRQASAAGALWNLAANEQNKFAIAQAGAIQPLVAMLYSDVREAQLSAAGALQNLCVNPSNKKTVAAAGGIEALMMLLSDKDRHVKAKAAGALQSLAVDEDNQKRIKSLGAIPLITKLLTSRTPEVQSNAAGALHNLAVNDEEAQEAVAAAGAIQPLINLMVNASPDLQAKAAATIWSIAGREENRRQIMELGGIPPLIRMVQSNHMDCQAKASGAIRCLTMSAFTRPEFEKGGVIGHLVALLSSGNQEITINAAGALENLGCR